MVSDNCKHEDILTVIVLIGIIVRKFFTKLRFIIKKNKFSVLAIWVSNDCKFLRHPDNCEILNFFTKYEFIKKYTNLQFIQYGFQKTANFKISSVLKSLKFCTKTDFRKKTKIFSFLNKGFKNDANFSHI